MSAFRVEQLQHLEVGMLISGDQVNVLIDC